MKIKKAASIPLITHDPFFSVWSPSDCLYERDTMHWSGQIQKLKAAIVIDGREYVFLGCKEENDYIPQKSIDVTATATEYLFENEDVILRCRFTSPLLLDDMLLTSRPCTYVDFEVEKKRQVETKVHFEVTADLVRRGKDDVMICENNTSDFSYGYMGRTLQQPLSGSDDMVSIDWGYVYAASNDSTAKFWHDKYMMGIHLQIDLENQKETGIIVAYDDLVSINYFGQWRKGYWTSKYATILDAIGAAFTDKADTLRRAKQLDDDIEKKAMAVGGEAYAYLCNLSFRQAISAHKLITDEEGNIVFLSKENGSNGCIGTVDVSYPSVPLFLLYDTEYVKGMLRPIFKFATYDVWEYDFAPHDVGRYPYAWGQVYAYRGLYGKDASGATVWCNGTDNVCPPFYLYPKGSDIYDVNYQMPVEECGNMLIMTAEVCRRDGNADFATPYWEILKLWKSYLVQYGADPGDQLCTDDFAGHLEHNTNLSIKAIMGIEAYAMLADMFGEKEEAVKHHRLAKEMATDWEERANAGDHYMLAFCSPETWSLKYNLVWDKLWKSKLFSDKVYETELSYYIEKRRIYGTPLDSRKVYTKSDWLLWCAAMAKDKEQAEALIQPIADYLENTQDRIPFGDWYDTESGMHYHFVARSVQGGIFVLML